MDVSSQWKGLSTSEAEAQRKLVGPNLLRAPLQHAIAVQFLQQFKNPLVVTLLIAAAISALSGEATGAIIIVLIVVLSVVLDFVQTLRAGKAVEQLTLRVSITASVFRDGVYRKVPVTNLVPGDVVQVSAGDLIPADALVLCADDLFVNQAQLTGEPYPVEKHAADSKTLETDLPTLAVRNELWSLESEKAVFMGSSVISGFAKILLVRTGNSTAIGQIAESLAGQPLPTDFEKGTRQFGILIMRLTVLLALFTLLVNLFLQRPVLDSFLFAVALAVGLTPELLPMVVSVTLAKGAMRMAALKVITKRPSAIQDMGAMDVLCTDKTGTLTQAHIRLERHINAQGVESESVLKLAYLNSYFESGLKSPMDEAILAHSNIDVTGWKKIDEVPFDFERRRVSTLLDGPDGRQLIVKGALEDILRLCTQVDDGNGVLVPLDTAQKKLLLNKADELGADGFRVLGIALRDVSYDHPHAVLADESSLTFAGFAGFLDPPKSSAGPAMQALARSGVAVKVVTGDSEAVTRHVCVQLGVPISGVLLGAQIAEMDDEALRASVEKVNLFCRVNPAQKSRIISALKARGHVVGYLGDGINDAPALHIADVGISVNDAVDVAKQAASMILLENDLSVLHAGIQEGRRTFSNVLKYIMMATSSNFGNMFSMAAATFVLPFLPMLPLQVLLNNLLYDVSEIAIPLDSVDDQELAFPHHWDMDYIRNYMLTIGPVSSVFDLLTFYLLLLFFGEVPTKFHTGWFIESMATQVLVIFVIRTRGKPWHSRPNYWLTLTSFCTVAVAAILPLTPIASYLGFVPLPWSFYGWVILLVIAYLLVVQWMKQWFYRRFAASSSTLALRS